MLALPHLGLPCSGRCGDQRGSPCRSAAPTSRPPVARGPPANHPGSRGRRRAAPGGVAVSVPDRVAPRQRRRSHHGASHGRSQSPARPAWLANQPGNRRHPVQDQIRGAFAAFRERKNAAVNGGDHVVHEAGVWSLGRDRGVAAGEWRRGRVEWLVVRRARSLGEPHSVRSPTDPWREHKTWVWTTAAVQPRERHKNGTAAGSFGVSAHRRIPSVHEGTVQPRSRRPPRGPRSAPAARNEGRFG